MFGYSEEQTMKQPFHFFVHTEDIEYVQLTLKETQKLSDSELNQVTFRIVTKANLTIWVEATFSNLFNQNETGMISSNEFLKVLQKETKNANINQVEKAWNAMLLDLPEERIQLIEKLKNNYSIYLAHKIVNNFFIFSFLVNILQ